MSYDQIVLANEKGEMVGVGKRIPAGLPRAVQSLRTPLSMAWIGFVNLQFQSKSIFALVVDRDGAGLFPIAGSAPVPATEYVSPDDVGPQIATLNWQGDPNWATGPPALPASVDLGVAPQGRVYSSWSGTRVNAGRAISATFAAPANGCLILPVLHGVSVAGISIVVADASANKAIVRIPMRNGEAQWCYWRVALDPRIERLQIIAEDHGRSSDQWLAVADPAQCR
jgi:hypothetical protein